MAYAPRKTFSSKKILPLVLFLMGSGLSGGCRLNSSEGALSNVTQGETQTTTKPKIVFNWSTGSGTLNQHLSLQTRDAMKKNRDIQAQNDLPPMGVQGYGLYAAMDPLATISYGSELSCLYIKSGTNWVDNTKAFKGDLKLANIKSPIDFLLYYWGDSFLDGQKKMGISGVIRDPGIVNLNQSAKFFMKESGSGDGLGPARINKARQRLQSGNLCQALQVFENEYETFSMAFASAFGIKKESYRSALASFWLMMPGDNGRNQKLAREIKKINNNGPLIQELNDAGLLKGNDPATREAEIFSIFSSTLIIPSSLIPEGIPEAQISARVALMARLFNETGLFQIAGNPTTIESFVSSFNDAISRFVSGWAQRHPDDISLAKDMVAILRENGLKGMSEQIVF